VLRLLREGSVAETLEAYTAPLLSRSGTIAVQYLRDQLDLSLGSAVRASGDAGPHSPAVHGHGVRGCVGYGGSGAFDGTYGFEVVETRRVSLPEPAVRMRDFIFILVAPRI
jgi:hypothetical protein